MRKETSNQFTDGLVSDLNPITTPNTVLTDNLNGTIITYNGNEFSLQNDQGNYELKHCRLKPNYIPVGIKEYGDILYIISYNPLDKHVEIGSYPSPLQVNEVEPNNTDAELVSIIDSEIINKGLLKKDYSELVKKEQQVIFNGDDFKMYPGDEYYFQTDNIDSPYYYEKFEYFILDEESNLHDITSDIQYGQNDPIFSDYKYVSWRIPGWLIAKARLARLSSAGMNIRSFYAPLVDVTTNTRTVFYDFNFRLNIEDYILKDTKSKYRFLQEKNIGFKVIFTAESPEGNLVNINGKDEYVIESFEPSYSEWYSDNYILWFSVKGQFDISGDSVIKVTLIPEITQYNNNKPLYTIVYNNLSQTEIFDLRKVNVKPWGVGESIYKFYINDDSIQQLEFDVTGPVITNGYIVAEYQLQTLDSTVIVDWTILNDYYGIGENYISIPFNNLFEKENIYLITFRFKEDDTVVFTSNPRIVFTTELLNGSENVRIYDKDFTLSDIVDKYFNYIASDLEDPEVVYEEIVNTDSTVEIEGDEIIKNYCDYTLDFNTFVPEGTVLDKNIIDVGQRCKQKVKIINKKYLNTGIWNKLISWKLYQDDEYKMLLNSYQETYDTTLDVLDSVKLEVISSIFSLVNFYRIKNGGYLSKMWIKNTHELNVKFTNGGYKLTWDDGSERFVDGSGCGREAYDLIEEFGKPLLKENACIYKVTCDPGTLLRYRNLDGSSSTTYLRTYWLTFKSSVYAEFDHKDSPVNVIVHIYSPVKSNLIKIMDKMAVIYDENPKLTQYTSYSSSVNRSQKSISFKLLTKIDMNDILYYGYNLWEADENISFFNGLKQNSCIKVSNYEFATEDNDLINNEISKIEKGISGESCNEQLQLWNKHPLIVNTTKNMKNGVFCSSNNERMMLLADKINKVIHTGKIELDVMGDNVDYRERLTPEHCDSVLSYVFVGASDYLDREEYETLERA